MKLFGFFEVAILPSLQHLLVFYLFYMSCCCHMPILKSVMYMKGVQDKHDDDDGGGGGGICLLGVV